MKRGNYDLKVKYYDILSQSTHKKTNYDMKRGNYDLKVQKYDILSQSTHKKN